MIEGENLEEMREELSELSTKRFNQDTDNKCPILEEEYRKLYFRVYYLDNKAVIKSRQLEYRETRRAKMIQNFVDFTEKNPDYAKEYREANQDKLKAYRRTYYLKNREAVLARIRVYQAKKKAEKND